MKTNQLFNIKRFGNYSKCSLISNYRQILLFWGAIWFAIFAFSLLSMRRVNVDWNSGGWIPIFLSVFYIGGLLYIGFAFPVFRNKKRTLTELMIPVSAFERFLYEFAEKIVVFFILYPAVFYFSSSMAVGVRNAFPVGISGPVVANTFQYKTVSFEMLSRGIEPGLFSMMVVATVMAFIIALAGAATFRKLPLIKTIVAIGLFFLVCIGYMYLLFEKLGLRHPWLEFAERNMTAQQGFMLGLWMFVFISIVALGFTYFKLSEKEVV